jgi:hypothetical protein
VEPIFLDYGRLTAQLARDSLGRRLEPTVEPFVRRELARDSWATRSHIPAVLRGTGV